jgi:hypothetical protein
MTASHRSGSFAPRPRSDGPPGIDWTHPAPDCPACWRSWLAGGELSAAPLVSRRTHAALAAATLALSSTAPAVVLASEPHHPRSHAALQDSDPLDPVLEAPGNDSPSAPVDADPEPSAPDPDVPDPQTTPAPAPVAQDPVAAPAEPDDPVHSGSDPAPEPPVPPLAAGSPPPAATVDPPSAEASAPVAAGSIQPSQIKRHTVYVARTARSHRSSRLSSPARTSTSRSPQTLTRTTSVPVGTRAPAAGRARPGDRAHVVRVGESLWSIAGDHLGGHASTARIAKEVKRLWQLNRGRIGTGDPNLLMAGTRLTLR